MESHRAANRAPKKSANLSIDSELFRQARQLKLNLSQTLERRLAEIIRDARARKWLEENQSALESYNQHVERNGAFSDRLRRF